MPKSVDALIVEVLTRPNWDQIWSAKFFFHFVLPSQTASRNLFYLLFFMQ